MFKFFVVTLVGIALAPLQAAAPTVLSQYREVTLGDSVAVVVERLQADASEVTVLYELPSVVQELTWKPHRFVSGQTVAPDPLAEMVLTFHLGRLTRIVAIYDRERTRGLTDADLLESLSEVYGLAMIDSAPTQPPIRPAAPRQTVGTWADADTVLLLWREEYPRRVGLTITSTVADRALQEAIAEGARLRAIGAPQRERDARAAAAAAIEDRDIQIRLKNKATFRP